MHYIKGIENYKNENRTAVTLGKFDGFHRGHMTLVNEVAKLSEEKGVDSVVCSFDMRPLFARTQSTAKLLMTPDERTRKLDGKIGYFIDCPFTKELSRIEAEEFIENILVGTFHAAYVVVGEDFCFGHGKRGNAYMLMKYASKYDYELIVFEKERHEGKIISSSYTKEMLSEGNMELVRELLGYPYTFTGVVTHGNKIGRGIGVPTLNVVPNEWKMMPPNGVYFMKVNIDGRWYNAIGNVGTKPTVTDSEQVVVESFLLDYMGDAYDKNVIIELHHYRRPERKFSGIEQMKSMILQDVAAGREFFKNN